MIHGFVQFFVSLPGVIVLGFLDAAFFFTLPLGIDAAVVILAARGGTYLWLTPLLAVAGSQAGAVLTYWTGAKIGDVVTIHGTDGEQVNPANAIARSIGTVTSDLLCAVAARVPRIYVS